MRSRPADRLISSAFRALGLLVAPLLMGAWAATANAQPDQTSIAAARKLGEEGVALYEAANYAAASAKLERAFAVVPAPTLGLWLGRALEKQSRFIDALQRYREVTLIALKATDSEILRNAQADAQQAYDALSERIPQLTITIEGAAVSDVTVTVDDKPVPSALLETALPLDPGTHTLVATADQQRFAKAVTLLEAEHRALSFTFAANAPRVVPTASALPGEPAPTNADDDAASASSPSSAPWFVVGAGVAVAATGGVFLALALDAKSNVAAGTRWSEVRTDYDKVPIYSTLGFAMLGAGVAAIGTGLVWKYALSGSEDASADGAVQVQASATELALTGTF